MDHGSCAIWSSGYVSTTNYLQLLQVFSWRKAKNWSTDPFKIRQSVKMPWSSHGLATPDLMTERPLENMEKSRVNEQNKLHSFAEKERSNSREVWSRTEASIAALAKCNLQLSKSNFIIFQQTISQYFIYASSVPEDVFATANSVEQLYTLHYIYIYIRYIYIY